MTTLAALTQPITDRTATVAIIGMGYVGVPLAEGPLHAGLLDALGLWNGEVVPPLREAVLLYYREIAFSAADVYARAAEARGLWDERLEALVVDSILSGEHEEELSSRVAALGWRARGSVAVLIGSTKQNNCGTHWFVPADGFTKQKDS